MKKSSGFTLIELSIVLIIISLLVSAVIVARTLIEQAEVRGLIKQIEQFQTGINAFQAKYQSLPGDMHNATSLWSDTANGNGDEQITYNVAGGNNEALRAWQQLGAASMIQGVYTGEGNSGQGAIPRENVPEINAGNSSGIYLHYVGWLGNDSANIMVIGSINSGTWNDGASLSPVQAGGLDNKMDDGFPGKGHLWSQGGFISGGYSSNCVSGTDASAIYAYENETRQCQVAIRIQ